LPGISILGSPCRTVYTQSPISDPPRHSFFAFGSCPSPPNLVGVALPKIRNGETPSLQSVGSKHSRFGFVDWDRGATSRVRQLFLRHSPFSRNSRRTLPNAHFGPPGSGGNRSTAWLGVILASSTTRRRVRFATGHGYFRVVVLEPYGVGCNDCLDCRLGCVPAFISACTGLLQTSIKRWGKRTTLTLCAISIGVAALVILISRG